MSLTDKIREIELEISKTQKNKATENHLGRLKAKLSKLRGEIIEKSRAKSGGVRFDIKKSGDASVALIGFPSVGKSSLLNVLTNAGAETGAYAFTTLNCIPGIMKYKNAQIQVLDLPGIMEGAHCGLGKGKEVLAVARGADLLILIVDVFNPRLDIIIKELYNIGIRINQTKPNIVITKKDKGGITINKTIKLTKITKGTVTAVLNEYKIHNAVVILRQDVTAEQLIDTLSKNRVYLPAVAVLNKSDLVSKEYIKQLKKKVSMNIMPLSAKTGSHIKKLKKEIYDKLNFIRIFTKSRGIKKHYDTELPLMMKKGATVKAVCQKLHRDMVHEFRYAMIWGKSAKHPGQKVGINHKLKDSDIITIIT